MVKYNHLYVVVGVVDPSVFRNPPELGQLLFWDWHGRYYTMEVLNIETGEVKPVLNIVWIKKLSEGERSCLDEKKLVSTCLDKEEIMELMRKRLERAKRYFNLTDNEIKTIMQRLRKAFER